MTLSPLAIILCGCTAVGGRGDRSLPVVTRPVTIKESERRPASTPGSPYTVAIEGRVTDSPTGMTTADATILVVTVTGSYEFIGGLFQISLPADTVANIPASAPGYYGTVSRQFKGHYKRNVTLDVEIRLEWGQAGR